MSEDLIHSNIINNYNRFLNGSVQKIDTTFNDMQPIESFEKILNSQMKGFDDIVSKVAF